MQDNIKYIILDHKLKDFLESDWVRILRGYISKYKDMGINEIRFIVRKDNKEDFLNIFQTLELKPRFIEDITKPALDDSSISDEEVYSIEI